jgi:cytochrome P450
MKASGPRGLEKLRLILRLQGPEILDAVFGLWKAHGDTVVVSLPFGQTLYFINDPADVMEILHKRGKKFIKGKALETFKLLIGNGVATSEQDEWVYHRRTVQPNFNRASLETYAPTVLRTIADHRRRWLAAGDGFQDFNKLLPWVSLDVVARTLLGADLSAELEELQRTWDTAMAFVVRRTYALARFPLGWPLPSHRRFNRAVRVIRNRVDSAVEREMRGKGSSDPNTFLARLLRSDVAGKLTKQEVSDQILNVLFAGLETTANALSSTLNLMLSHPDVHAKVLAELNSIVGSNPPTYAALEKQWYLRQVVHEALRLYPPVSIFVREALEPVELSAGILPKGAIVMLSPFVVHRQPKLWDEPEQFKPERFTSMSLMGPPHFFAFGAGGRTCPGDQFAINEMMFVLTDIFQNLVLELDTSRPVGLTFNGTLRSDPLRIRVTPIH